MNVTTDLLKKLMDTCTIRQNVLANNLANANTPGFLRKDVVFREALADALRADNLPGATGKSKLAAATPEVKTDRVTPPGPRGNNVSTQKELGLMAENGLLYGVAVRALNGRFSTLRKAIKGT